MSSPTKPRARAGEDSHRGNQSRPEKHIVVKAYAAEILDELKSQLVELRRTAHRRS